MVRPNDHDGSSLARAQERACPHAFFVKRTQGPDGGDVGGGGGPKGQGYGCP